MNSTFFFNVSSFGYILSLFLHCLILLKTFKYLKKYTHLILILSFVLQTCGLALRWIEAGFIEIDSYQKSSGVLLYGLEKYIVLLQHPPWSNLYEIMMYMSWGLIFIFLFIDFKWNSRSLALPVLTLTLILLALCSLTNNEIKPLVPALKSWWLLIHVITASLAYSLGTIGAISSFFYLIKNIKQIKSSTIAIYSMVISFSLYIILGRGFFLFKNFNYNVKLLSSFNSTSDIVYYYSTNGPKEFYIESPFVGYLLLLSIFFSFLTLCYLTYTTINKSENKKISIILYTSTFLATIATVLNIIFNIFLKNIPIFSSSDLNNFLQKPPYFIGFKSNHWDLSIFCIILLIQLIILLTLFFPEKILKILPSHEKIDDIAYNSILLAFCLVGLVLITGSLWAHYAWGRYWGWDPKEIGALVIWLSYALYLHVRLSFSLVHAAFIGSFSFFIILMGFLGVNLGLFTTGLHSYGSI